MSRSDRKRAVIVDTHVHVIAEDEVRYPLNPTSLSGEWYRTAPCSADRLESEMLASGVDRAVLVQAKGAYTFDNRYIADSAAANPNRFTAACCIDPNANGALDELDRWLGAPQVEGLRIFALARDNNASWLADPKTFPIWERAAERGAHIIVTIFSHQLADLRRVLERFPEIDVSLDHCAFPDIADPSPLLRLTDLGNLHLKVSTHVLDAAQKLDGEPNSFVERLVHEFGADRIMWGSDFCQTHDRSYAELVAFGRSAFSELPPADRDACLGGTALRLWPTLQRD